MKSKIANSVVWSALGLTAISFLILIVQLVNNVRRMFVIETLGVFSVIVTSILVLASLTLITYIIVLSFLSFFSNEKVDMTKYMNGLILAIVFRLILYVIFGLGDLSQSTGIYGFLNDVHYSSYVLTYRTDILPVTVFPNGTLSFAHSLIATDVTSIGLVVLGIVLSEKDRYSPAIGAVLAIVVTFIFVISINVIIAGSSETGSNYYNFFSVMGTLVIEFAMLGYAFKEVFGVQYKRKRY